MFAIFSITFVKNLKDFSSLKSVGNGIDQNVTETDSFSWNFVMVVMKVSKAIKATTMMMMVRVTMMIVMNVMVLAALMVMMLEVWWS